NRTEPDRDVSLVGARVHHLGELRARHARRDPLDVHEQRPGFGGRQRHLERIVEFHRLSLGRMRNVFPILPGPCPWWRVTAPPWRPRSAPAGVAAWSAPARCARPTAAAHPLRGGTAPPPPGPCRPRARPLRPA